MNAKETTISDSSFNPRRDKLLGNQKTADFVTSRPGSTRAFEDSGGTNIQAWGRITHTSQSIYTKRLECLAMNVNVILRNASTELLMEGMANRISSSIEERSYLGSWWSRMLY